MIEAREPPHSIEAEKVVLAMAVNYSEFRHELLTLVQPVMFFKATHRNIWVLISKMVAEEQPVELSSLAVFADSQGMTDAIGGIEGLVEATDAHSATPKFFAKKIKQCYLLRELIGLGRDISEKAYEPESDPDELLSTISQQVTDLITTGTTSSEVRLSDSVQEVLGAIEERIQTQGTVGYSTGFPGIDAQIGGLRPGQLIVVAARPAVGKSALALNIAQTVADEQGAALFVSLEMAHTEQAERVLSYESGLGGKQMQSPEWSRIDRQALFDAVNAVGNTPLLFLDNSFDLDSIMNKSRAIHRKHELKLIVVDYLQLCEVNGVPESQRERAVAKLSRAFKRLAQELQLPVIALSQLNRELEKRSDKRPMLSDLRESGAIEQDANVVMFIHRPDVFNQEDRPGEADVIVAKNRNGGTGIVQLRFQKHLTRFVSDDGYSGF